MRTVLITGANKGLGRETARQLSAAGYDVWIGSREPRRGEQAAKAVGARAIQMDVTDRDSVAAAARRIAAATGGNLDVLINNAAVPSTFRSVAEMTAEDVQAVHAVNVLGPVRVLWTVLGMLRAKGGGVVVNVSSGLGSHASSSDPEDPNSQVHLPDYQSSKAALNMLTAQWAVMLPELRVNCADPGHTATDLGGPTGPLTVERGVRPIVALATIDLDGPTGTFLGQDGPMDW